MTTNVNRNRPNTGVRDIFLSADMILCCGEDWGELLTALAEVTAEKPYLLHEYRCYRVAKFASFSLIWSGMGTGCLEPLLYELRDVPFLRNIVLVGTAGAVSTDRIKLGEVCFCEFAFLGGAAVHLPDSRFPLTPRFEGDLVTQARLKGARVASTDYYYGFSRNPPSQVLRSADAILEGAVAQLFDKVDLIDMETAQFYHFCRALFPGDRLHFIALKGAANSLSEQALQTDNSPSVLRAALEASFVLLKVTAQTPPVAAAAVMAPKDDPPLTKLMEEVKLFWTIQIAVCGVLGYLGTNLTLNAPELSSAALVGSVYLKNLCISAIALFLLQIGAIYNLVGNYYARVAASGTRFALQQENRITPTLAFFYLAISGLIAALAIKSGIPGASERWIITSGLAGLFLNGIICRAIVYKALAGKAQQTEADYATYSLPLRRVYLWTIILFSALACLALYLTRPCFR